ncbi:hypothetical protein B4U80_10085 [Leptotrombidium deliense]|uniref:rRNA-processing protein EBP2-like protein n=1 Tax=Leptotrombidium deliense TaxID=299467 RepID=A0A443SDQ3_9ACAR|nr:hypothetical protein B4U80_10085 [Leptotrombidium deliense]
MKSKNKVKVLVPEVEEQSNSSADEFEDSDEELQEAFAKGELKPGLNAIVPLVKKTSVNNVNGLKSKLQQIKLNAEWIERLDSVNGPASLPENVTQEYGDLKLKINRKGFVSSEELSDAAQHDFKRELCFYQQAQAAVLECIPKLHKLKVKTKRPEDYFAEMVKSDEHMKRMRTKLIAKQSAIERSEKARRLRQEKKMGKEVQKEILMKRQKEKKQLMENVKKFKKGEESLDFLNEPQKQQQKKNSKKLTKKAKYKNERFGYGGVKKRGKYNTADSAADISGFRAKKHASKGKVKAKPNRPGKQRRRQMKSRKR